MRRSHPPPGTPKATKNIHGMKKLLLVLTAALCVSAASAQKGEMAAGLNLNTGFAFKGGNYNNVGLGAKFQYSFTDHLRVEPAFTYYFEKDDVSMWDLMANMHYIFRFVDNQLNVYPLAGIGVCSATIDLNPTGSETQTNFAVNIGGGVEYKVSRSVAIGAELKYQFVKDYGHLAMQVGVTYSF